MFSSKFFATFFVTCLASSVLAAITPASPKDVKPEQICSRCWPVLFDFESEQPSAFSLVEANDADPLQVPLITECYYTEIDDANKQTNCLYNTKTGELAVNGNPDKLCPEELMKDVLCDVPIRPKSSA